MRTIIMDPNINHTRSETFGVSYVNTRGETVKIDGLDFLRNFAKRLDEEDIAIDDFLGQQNYMAQYYYHEVLKLKSDDPFDWYAMNDVENLPTFNMKYEFMALYDLYKMGDKYRLNFAEWMDQPMGDVEYQIELGRKAEARRLEDERKAKLKGGKEAVNEMTQLDQTANKVDLSMIEEAAKLPFQKDF